MCETDRYTDAVITEGLHAMYGGLTNPGEMCDKMCDRKKDKETHRQTYTAVFIDLIFHLKIARLQRSCAACMHTISFYRFNSMHYDINNLLCQFVLCIKSYALCSANHY